MKNILLVLFLLIFCRNYSQNIELSIVVKDVDTNLPIEDATVYILKTKQTVLTNSQGVATFELNGTSNIQITHTSYLLFTLRSTAIKKIDGIVLLKNNLNPLDEVIITNQHPQKILKSLVDNSTKKLSVPARLKVYSREFFKLNGTNSYYNDGLMNFQISRKSNDFSTNILVEQNRSYGLIEKNISDDLLGYNLNNIMENYYNFKYLNPVLEVKAKKKYDYIVKAYVPNEDYYLMKITPVDYAKGLLDEFTIIYDKKRKIIIEVSSVISPVALANNQYNKSKDSKNIYKSYFKTIYRFDASNYYLLSSKEEIGYERINKNRSTDIQVKNYLITTNFSNKNYSFKESEVFKDKTLFNKSNVILTEYWNVSGLTATNEEQQIIEQIKEEE